VVERLEGSVGRGKIERGLLIIEILVGIRSRDHLEGSVIEERPLL